MLYLGLLKWKDKEKLKKEYKCKNILLLLQLYMCL